MGLGIHLGNINKFEAGVSHDPISFSEAQGSSYGASIERGRRQEQVVKQLSGEKSPGLDKGSGRWHGEKHMELRAESTGQGDSKDKVLFCETACRTGEGNMELGWQRSHSEGEELVERLRYL